MKHHATGMKPIQRWKVLAKLNYEQHLILAEMLHMQKYPKCYTCEQFHKKMRELEALGVPIKHARVLVHAQVRTLFGRRLRKMAADQFIQNHLLDDAMNNPNYLPHLVRSPQPLPLKEDSNASSKYTRKT